MIISSDLDHDSIDILDGITEDGLRAGASSSGAV